MRAETLEALLEARRERRPLVRLLWLDSGDEVLVDPSAIDPALGEALTEEVVGAAASDVAARVETGAGRVLVHPFNPPLRLAIVGAVHIAQHLARQARDLRFDVTIIDPRRGFLTEARFPDTTLDPRWPDEALRAFGPDRRSAVVTLSHDAKLDEPALQAALESDCFYIGALGSRRTQARRRARLLEAGLSEAALDRIHGPIGLDLGAKSPAEIALSVAAELVATLRGRSASA